MFSRGVVRPLSQAKRVIDVLGNVIKPGRLERMKNVLEKRTNRFTLVLENTVDTQNASACLRSAEGFGLNNVHIVDYLNTFYTGSSASKNAELWMSVNRYKKASECIAQLKEQNYKIITTECRDTPDSKTDIMPVLQSPLAVPHSGSLTDLFKTINRDDGHKYAIVLGNENRGVSKHFSSVADGSFMIPTNGFVQSYNLSVCCGIILYHFHEMGFMTPDLSKEEKENILANWLLRVPYVESMLKKSGIEMEDLLV